METERSSNLRFFVVVVNFEKKSCSVIYSNSLLIARGLGVDGKQQVEVQVPNYRLVDGGGGAAAAAVDGHHRLPLESNVHRNKFLPGSPQSFQICPQELGLFLLNV